MSSTVEAAILLDEDDVHDGTLPGHVSSRSSRKRAFVESTSNASLSCKRCRNRKVKCDGALPSCSGCSKAGVACIVGDYTTSREYTRREAHELEARARYLETLLDRPGTSAQLSRPVPNPASEANSASQPTQMGDSPSRYVGREVGVDFFQPMLEAIRNQSPAALTHILAPPPASIIHHEPHTLPPREDSLRIVAAYLRGFHVAHPFLDTLEIAKLFHHLHSPQSISTAQNSGTENPRRDRLQKLFRANMILAIGAVRPFRSGEMDLHPFGFFTAALEATPPSSFNFGSIRDVEDLLLIAHFGVYHNIGCSIWELSRLCIRICIELQLHRESLGEDAASLEQLQRRRRVFWESYYLDRYSSSALGRPFAIAEDIIDIELAGALPVHLRQPLPPDLGLFHEHWPRYAEAEDRTVFNHLLALIRITSRFQSPYYLTRTTGRTHHSATSESEESYDTVRLLYEELQIWRQCVPFYDEPKCLYQSSDYFDLCFQREKLYLIRVAIDRSPMQSSLPPPYLLNPCLRTACTIIRIFGNLRQQGLVTYTRKYTHLIFTTSLIIVFLVFAQVQVQSQQRRQRESSPSSSSIVGVESWWAELFDDGNPPTLRESLETLSTAENILDWLAHNMSDMSAYAQFLTILKRELEREMSKATTKHTNAMANIQQVTSQATQATTSDEYPTRNQAAAWSSANNAEMNTSTVQSGIDSQDVLLEGILFNFFPGDGISTEDPVPSMNSSWPFSQIPWIESINSELFGYDLDTTFP